MSDDLEQDPGIRLGVAAALGRKYAEDQQRFFESLADLLEAILPEATRVDRGGFFSRKGVRKVQVDLDDNRYALEGDHGRVNATHTRIVRGIALKTEPLPIEAWVERLGEALEMRAADSASARAALERLVG